MKFFWMLVLVTATIQLELSAATASRRRNLHLPTEHFAHYLRTIRDAGKTCTYEEFYQKTDALFCEESYLTAVKEEFEQSNCRNTYGEDYDYDYENASSLPCEEPRDEKENVRNCTEACSFREFFYIFCTTIGERYAGISRECGMDQIEYSVSCDYDKGDFCYLKYNLTKSLYKKCGASDECSASCKMAVETYVEETGCCAYYWRNYEEGDDRYYENGNDETTISDIFSACGVEIPDKCIVDFDLPKEFLDCARDPTVNEGATVIASLLMIFVGTNLAQVFAGF